MGNSRVTLRKYSKISAALPRTLQAGTVPDGFPESVRDADWLTSWSETVPTDLELERVLL